MKSAERQTRSIGANPISTAIGNKALQRAFFMPRNARNGQDERRNGAEKEASDA